MISISNFSIIDYGWPDFFAIQTEISNP